MGLAPATHEAGPRERGPASQLARGVARTRESLVTASATEIEAASAIKAASAVEPASASVAASASVTASTPIAASVAASTVVVTPAAVEGKYASDAHCVPPLSPKDGPTPVQLNHFPRYAARPGQLKRRKPERLRKFAYCVH